MKNIFLIAALIVALTTFATAQKLETGKTFEREIGGTEKHIYDVQLKKDEAYNLVVEQRGVDVVLRIYSPDGNLAGDIDTPNGNKGDEPLLFVAPSNGNYRVEISPFDSEAPKGRYFIKTVATRSATKAEREEAQLKIDLMTAIRTFDDAHTRGDKAAVERTIADDYMMIGRDGRVSYKADTIKGLPEPKDAGNVKITHKYSNVQVRNYGETALLSFLDDPVIQIGDQTINDQVRVTKIFRRNNGQWHLAAQHETTIKKVQDPPIVKMDPKVLSEYVGQYEISPSLKLVVETDGEKLFTYTSDPENKSALYPMGENTFFYKGLGDRVVFVREASGKVTEAVNNLEDGNKIKAKKIK